MPIPGKAPQPTTAAPTKPDPTKPYWRSECGRATVYVGDCCTVLAAMEPEQFHAVVTDPPYGLEFMGKDWDAPWKQSGAVIKDPAKERGGFQDGNGGNPYSRSRIEFGRKDSHGFQAWFLTCAEQILCTAKPGAHLLSFGGTRMWHRMACAVEDAGFEIRDTVMWVYGSGFPKGHDVSKAIDKILGAEREIMGTAPPIWENWEQSCDVDSRPRSGLRKDNAATAAAAAWQGWNTALKPAVEPIILARKPLPGTVAQCVMEHGTGALNIDECRVGTEQVGWYGGNGFQNTHEASKHGGLGSGEPRPVHGRWPANLILSHHPDCKMIGSRASKDIAIRTVSTGEVVSDNVAKEVWRCHQDCPVYILNKQSGSSKSVRSELTSKPGKVYGMGAGLPSHTGIYRFDDSGGAARYFYTVKANADDRPHAKGTVTQHPTVKPLDLMQYLVRLVCSPGGTILDPFMGSGSTGCAAIVEGMRFVGVEQSVEYADIAVGRLKLALAGKGVQDTPPPPKRLRGAE